MRNREFSLKSIILARIITLSIIFIIFTLALLLSTGNIISNNNKDKLLIIGNNYAELIKNKIDKEFLQLTNDAARLEKSGENIETLASVLSEKNYKTINIYKKNNDSYILSFYSDEKPRNSVLTKNTPGLHELFGGGTKVYTFAESELLVINYFSHITKKNTEYIVNIRKTFPFPLNDSLKNFAIITKNDYTYIDKNNEIVTIPEQTTLYGHENIKTQFSVPIPSLNAAIIFDNDSFSSQLTSIFLWIIAGLILLYIIWFVAEISFLKFSTNPIFQLIPTFKKISQGDKKAGFVKTKVKEFNIIADAAKSTVDALLNEQSKTETLLNRLPVPVAVFDLNYNFIYKNKHFTTLFNIADNTEATFLDIIPASMKDLENQLMLFVNSPKQKDKSEIHDPKNDSYYIVRFAKIFDNNEHLSAIMVVFNDITFQKRETEKQTKRSKRVENILLSIEEAVLQLSTSSSELNSTAEALSTMLAQQNTSVAETNTSIHEMNTSVANISKSINQITELTDKITSDSEYGVDIMENAFSKINNVKDKMDTLVTTINDLNGKTAKITKILKTVYDISEQTNLLALNASIEAVRSDSGSQSFKVIAEEIRELSDKTFTFTKEIEEGLEKVVNSGNSSVMIVEETEKMLLESYNEIDSSKNNFIKIKNGIMEINSSLHNINNVLDDLNNASSDIYQTSNDLVSAMKDAVSSSKETQQTAHDIDSVSKTLRETLQEIDKLKQ